MATKGLKVIAKSFAVTDPLPRRVGRPRGRKLRTSTVLRIPDTLIRQCRKALIKAKLAARDLSVLTRFGCLQNSDQAS